MEPSDVYYNQQDYIETVSGNKVCKKSVLLGSQNIMLHGKVGVDEFGVLGPELNPGKNYKNLIVLPFRRPLINSNILSPRGRPSFSRIV